MAETKDKKEQVEVTPEILTKELEELTKGKSSAELMDMVDRGELTNEQLDALMADTKDTSTKKKKSGKKRKHEGETKICKCIVSGKDVEVSKFMSCDKVIHPDHLPEGTQRGSKAKYEGTTKILPCIDCGIDVEVTKFASPATVRCAEHRALARKSNKVSRTSGLYEIKNKEVIEDLQSLKEERVLGFKETLHENVYEISAVPNLLSVLENNFPISEFIESDTAGNGEEQEREEMPNVD